MYPINNGDSTSSDETMPKPLRAFPLKPFKTLEDLTAPANEKEALETTEEEIRRIIEWDKQNSPYYLI